jgi:hypothetical protein
VGVGVDIVEREVFEGLGRFIRLEVEEFVDKVVVLARESVVIGAEAFWSRQNYFKFRKDKPLKMTP